MYCTSSICHCSSDNQLTIDNNPTILTLVGGLGGKAMATYAIFLILVSGFSDLSGTYLTTGAFPFPSF